MTSSQSSQKVLLAKALQVANTAVHLDEAGDVKGAMSSYLDACSGLQLAMHGIEDREKVKSIRDTYIKRVGELKNMVEDKTLPAKVEGRSLRSP